MKEGGPARLGTAFCVMLCLGLALRPKDARGCGTAPPCAYASLYGAPELIPSNTPLLGFSAEDSVRESDVQIFETTDGQRVQFGGWQLKRVDGRPEAIEFLEELEVDAAYSVEVHHECTEVPTVLQFRVGQRASLPTELGRLQADAERRQVSRFDGFSCEDVAFDAVVVTVSMDWAEDALPWRDLIRWNIGSDEKRLYGLGPGDTKPLFLPCEAAGFGELSEGDSELIARAVLPGTDVELESEATSLQVSCERSYSTDGSVVLGNDAEPDEYAPPAAGCRLSVPGSVEAEGRWLWLFGLLACALHARSRLA